MGNEHVAEPTQGERIARLEVAHEHLADSMRDAFERLTDEVRAMSGKLDGMPSKDSIDSVRDEVESLRKHVDRKLTSIDTDNHATKRKIAWFGGVAFSIVLLGGAIVGGFVYTLNYRFDETGKSNDKQDEEIKYNRSKIDRLTERQNALEVINAQRGAMPQGNPQ